MRNRLGIIVYIVIMLLLAATVVGCNDNKPSSQNNGKTGTSGKKISDKSSDNAEKDNTKVGSKSGFDWKTLLTKEEAMAILNATVDPAEYKDTKNPLGQKIIFWPVAGELKFSYVQLSLITTDGMKQQLRDGGSSAKTQFDSEKEVLGKVENISGIGDEAYWDGDTPLISGLHVRKGDYYFTVMVNSDDKDSQLELEKAQAMKILERLP